jgi:hypothetical protein
MLYFKSYGFYKFLYDNEDSAISYRRKIYFLIIKFYFFLKNKIINLKKAINFI